MRAQYDFSKMKTVRGKYSGRFAFGTNPVALDTEHAKAFPADEAVRVTIRDARKNATRSAKPAKATRAKR